jgi:protoporphyrin/coproporphyrin ferrochelatase
VSRTAVVLFNLGGPDGPAAVRPFLRNLFRDPAIIQAPAIVRLPLAEFISRTRENAAKANYAMMGGGSPLLPETQAQAAALDRVLAARMDGEARSFIAMRYWRPLTEETARAVAAYAPDDVVLLPLYPQFSTTTTGSSVKAWLKAYRGPGRVHTVCCYPVEPGLVRAHAQRIRETWEAAGRPEGVRLLFSAHGLPQRVVDAGDPYQAQVEASCAAVAAELGEGWDWTVCYQSRVGPLQWLGPSTEEAIQAAVQGGRGVLIAPIAFVSEHVETLVELDHEYRQLAESLQCPTYLRASALGVADAFVEGLADAVVRAVGGSPAVASACGGRWCPAQWSKCPAPAG